ncbi:MAG: fumarylacetoacetate hydrolase family protein [Pseudomonadales bacterium]|nr:fumarylacetoacetate hydrolase family protein [Pseudomonadales bacterium]
MSVNTVRFEHNGKTQWGVVRDDQVIVIPGEYLTTGEFVAAFSAADLKDIKGEAVPLNGIKILSPITTNQRFVCQGANYRKHMEESGMDPDEKNFNMIFTKASSCLSPYNTEVIRPSSCELLDYEVELGIVLKKPITGPLKLSEGNLHEYVAGALIVNDVSARDIQVPQMQFYKGKSFRTFGPAGPFLCLLDKQDMHYLDNLQLTLKVNGEVRQSNNTRDMVYRPAETLTELSQVHDFAVGDLLATGTPAGCALSVPSPAKQKLAALLPESVKWKMFIKMQKQRTQYLQPGDEIETTIKSPDGFIDLGVQRNKIIQG